MSKTDQEKFESLKSKINNLFNFAFYNGFIEGKKQAAKEYNYLVTRKPPSKHHE